MRRFGYRIAGLAGVGIIWIGTRYLVQPGVVAPTFGVPDPPAATDPFLRVKGVRDIASGVVVLSLMATRQPRVVAVALLAESVIPIGDAVIVLGHGGSPAVAYGVHGATAAAMIAAAGALLRSAGPSGPAGRASPVRTG